MSNTKLQNSCPTCSGRDPYRSTEDDITRIVDAIEKNCAKQLREAWRSFWSYRAEELRSFWNWFSEDVQTYLIFVGGFLGIIATAIIVVLTIANLQISHNGNACSELCNIAGPGKGVYYKHDCWCVGSDGTPQRWAKEEKEKSSEQ